MSPPAPVTATSPALLQKRPRVLPPFVYPIYGLYFFLRHPSFWPLFGRRLIPLSIISLLVYGFLFTFTFLPQAAFLAIFNRSAALLSAVFLVLGEGAVLVQLLFEAFFVDETLVDIFDATLLTLSRPSLLSLVSTTRPILPAANAIKALGRPYQTAEFSPFSFRQIAEFIFFIPLNLIPYAGVPLFLLLTGRRAGPLLHWRYFKLLGLHKKERNREIKKRRWGYTGFGTVALILQLIPVLSMFFLLTTASGAALWAAALEEQRIWDDEQSRVQEDYHDQHDTPAQVPAQSQAQHVPVGSSLGAENGIKAASPPPYADDAV